MGIGSKKQMESGLVGLLVLLLMVAMVRSQTKSERLRLIRADYLRHVTVAGEIQQRLEGNVQFEQGETSISCDLAIRFLQQSKAALIGNVRIQDETRMLFADTVYFYEEDARQVAIGKVKSITEDDTTYAERITFFEPENRVVSEGKVRIIDPEDRTELRGETAEYLRDKKYGKIYGEPMWSKFDSSGAQVTRVHADTMEIFESEQRVFVDGNVRIFQESLRATCGQADFFQDAEQIVLKRNPEVWQSNQHITGDSLRLFLRESQLQEATVTGNAVATSDADTLSKGRWVNKLAGKAMRFHFEEEKLQHVLVTDQASSLYHIIEDESYKGATSVSGDTIEIRLSAGEVKEIRVNSDPGLANGKYLPPEVK